MGKLWNRELITQLWDNQTTDPLVQIPLGGYDTRCWGSHPAGTCSVKSIYKSLAHMPIGPHLPWKSEFPSNIKIFLWKLLIDRLPTRLRLHKLHLNPSPICVLCREHDETSDHLFSACIITQHIWNRLPRSIPRPFNTQTFAQWRWGVATGYQICLGAWITWFMWKMRNYYIFQTQPIILPEVLRKTKNSNIWMDSSHLYPLSFFNSIAYQRMDNTKAWLQQAQLRRLPQPNSSSSRNWGHHQRLPRIYDSCMHKAVKAAHPLEAKPQALLQGVQVLKTMVVNNLGIVSF